MYITGEPVDMGHFSREIVGNKVDDYIVNTKKLSERQWKSILGSCGAHAVAAWKGDQDGEISMTNTGTSSMEKRRRVLYIPSSPVESAGGSDME
jgi:hypothetical protein